MSEQPRAAVGSLQGVDAPTVSEDYPGRPFNPGEPRSEGAAESVAPQEQMAAEVTGALAAINPAALIANITGLVDTSVKVLGFVSKLPGPQQAEAVEALKLLTILDTLLHKF